MSRLRHKLHTSPAVALLMAGMIYCANATAQVGNDPTRPPSGLADGTADMDAADAGGGMMLQSVFISPTSKAALISGVMVKLGEKYGDAVLLKVAETEVVLKSGTTSQVLKLHPGVEKRDTASTAPKGAPRRKAAGDDGAAPR